MKPAGRPVVLPSNKWFDDLGFSSKLKSPLVSLSSSATGGPGDIAGFVLSRRNGVVKVLTPDLRVSIYNRQSGVATAPVDFEDWAGKQLKLYEANYQLSLKASKAGLGHLYDFASEAYVVSAACSLRGDSDLANRSMAYAKKFASLNSMTLDQDVLKGAEGALFNQLYANFDDHDYTREDLDGEFRKYVAEFPHCPYTVRARQDLSILDRMLAEDHGRAVGLPITLSRLPKQERIAEEIYRLRDHFGNSGDPYQGDIVYGMGAPPTPVPTDLPAIESNGVDAVPQLIRSLKDPTFTRNICDDPGRTVTLRVGDVCERILEHIAHQEFAVGGTAPMRDEPKLVEKAVGEWWASYQSQGEKAALISSVESNDQQSVLDSARILAQKYPDDATSPIAEAITKPWDSGVRMGLINDLGLIRTPEAQTVLQGIKVSAPDVNLKEEAGAFVHDYSPDVAWAAAAKLHWR